MTAEAEKVTRGEKVEGRYLTYFLSQTGLPMKTVYSNVTELLLAGVDTVRAITPPQFFIGVCCQSKRFIHLHLFRSPAPCPGRCTSCPVTPRCRPHSAKRFWVYSGVVEYQQQPMWPACLSWRPQSKKCFGITGKGLPYCLKTCHFLPSTLNKSSIIWFPDCTLLFLPMLGSLQKETSRWEATSSRKMWVCWGISLLSNHSYSSVLSCDKL